MNEFIIAGIGGQGVITCSKIVSTAALQKGYDVRSTETIGMAQRGGSVTSHIRMGQNIYCPFIAKGQADEVISMDFREAIRYQAYLKESGRVSAPVLLDSKNNSESYQLRPDIDVRCYDLSESWEKVGSSKYTNIIMLGIVFYGGRYLISERDIRTSIMTLYSGKRCEKNLDALQLGVDIAKGEIEIGRI